ncbi:MAG: DUF2505 domain-containing protein [Corynebacterium sp.]|nr:DUF2505 domain-containing protein [Corynebacterium sp.]
MTTRSEHSVVLPNSVAQVHQALNTPEYWSYIAENLSPEAGSLHEFTSDSPAVTTLFEVLPQDLLPEAVRAMISQSLKVKRVITITELNNDAFSADYTADVKGTPVDFKGAVAVAGSEESTTFSYQNEVTVNIPFMGSAIEPKVVEAIGELLDNQGKLTSEWINNNL